VKIAGVATLESFYFIEVSNDDCRYAVKSFKSSGRMSLRVARAKVGKCLELVAADVYWRLVTSQNKRRHLTVRYERVTTRRLLKYFILLTIRFLEEKKYAEHTTKTKLCFLMMFCEINFFFKKSNNKSIYYFLL